jgi:hypothetical protein
MSVAPITAILHAEHLMLMARYDYCSFSPAIFVVVRDLEVEISWIEHRLWARRAVAPSPQTAGKQRGVSSTAQDEVNAEAYT